MRELVCGGYDHKATSETVPRSMITGHKMLIHLNLLNFLPTIRQTGAISNDGR
jgi:hypothetical protein